MSDYTPTLEDAKRTYAYIQGGLDHDEGYKPFYQIHEEEFDRLIAEVRRQAAEEALLQAADAFEVGGINIEVFGDSVEARLWQMSNQTRASLVKSLRARAEAYRQEREER